MAERTFSDIGRVRAIELLYEGTGFKPFERSSFESSGREHIISASKVLLEGIDFDLVYFPLKHLGYKSVLGATGELYAAMAHPHTLDIVLGVSSKLDFEQIRELWLGIVAAAKEHGYASVGLELVPSRNGLCISVAATGVAKVITRTRMPAPKSKDLICVSGALGAAFLGYKALERELDRFNDGDHTDREKHLEQYKMLVAAYLKPELPAGAVTQLEAAEIYPSCGLFVTAGLADAIKRLQRETGLGAKVYADKIPFEGNSFQLGKELDIDPVSAAMNGGDDYRLLFTIPILSLEDFRRDFQTFDIVGHLALPEAGGVLVTPEGAELPLRAQGWPEEED